MLFYSYPLSLVDIFDAILPLVMSLMSTKISVNTIPDKVMLQVFCRFGKSAQIPIEYLSMSSSETYNVLDEGEYQWSTLLICNTIRDNAIVQLFCNFRWFVWQIDWVIRLTKVKRQIDGRRIWQRTIGRRGRGLTCISNMGCHISSHWRQSCFPF